MRQNRQRQNLRKLDKIAKTGRENAELHVNFVSIRVACVHKHKGGSQDALETLLKLI